MILPVGQSTSLPSTDENISSGELSTQADGTSEENPFDSTLEEILAEKENPFDSTLEEMLAENEIDQALLEDMLENEDLALPLATTFMAQNFTNTDMLGESNKSSDSLANLTQLLKKSDPILQDEFMALDPRISTKDLTGLAGTIKGQGTPETALQNGFDKYVGKNQSLKEAGFGLEKSREMAQQVLHTVDSFNEEKLAETKLQDIMGQKMIDENMEFDAVQETMARRFQTAGMIRPGEVIEEVNSQALNNLASLASKETKVSGDLKSPVDMVMPTSLAATSETSGSSVFKGTEVTTRVTESFQNTDLPFDMEQVVGRVRILRGNGTEEMTLRLHPEELGQVTLKVRQSGGDLSIEMRVDNPLAKQLIENGFETLRSRFLDQEFAYQDLALNVDVGQRDQQFESNQDGSDFQDEIFAAESGTKEEKDAVNGTNRMRPGGTDSGLNLYV